VARAVRERRVVFMVEWWIDQVRSDDRWATINNEGFSEEVNGQDNVQYITESAD
jgi:hypothetical protein